MDEKGGNYDSFYTFFIIALVYLITFLRSRAKKKKEQEEMKRRPLPPRPSPRASYSPPKLPTTTKSIWSSKQDSILLSPNNKRKSRIVKLVGSLSSKKDLILLSEILSKNPWIK